MMFARRSRASMAGLPDPLREPEFYNGVTVKRGLAWVLDTLVTLALCLLLLPFTAFTAVFWWPLLWLTLSFGYRWATLAKGSGTWGMRLMAIEIRDRDGGRLDAAAAFAHVLGYSACMAMFPLQVLSVILMFVLGRGQGLTDLVLGSAAINRPV